MLHFEASVHLFSLFSQFHIKLYTKMTRRDHWYIISYVWPANCVILFCGCYLSKRHKSFVFIDSKKLYNFAYDIRFDWYYQSKRISYAYAKFYNFSESMITHRNMMYIMFLQRFSITCTICLCGRMMSFTILRNATCEIMIGCYVTGNVLSIYILTFTQKCWSPFTHCWCIGEFHVFTLRILKGWNKPFSNVTRSLHFT